MSRPEKPTEAPAEEDEPPPRLLSTPFWLALAFGVACVLAGLAVALSGHRAPSPPRSPTVRTAALDAAAAP